LEFEFEIMGEPVGKGRPRFTRNGHTYTPEKTANFETLVKLSFQQAYPSTEPIAKAIPIEVKICACFSVPKSATKKDLKAIENGTKKPTKKPDTDNIAKAVCDALNGIAYYDDSQITTLTVYKLYSNKPHTKVIITEQEGH
jgi:Holliday junction resolvase RusA-like endonuclease